MHSVTDRTFDFLRNIRGNTVPRVGFYDDVSAGYVDGRSGVEDRPLNDGPNRNRRGASVVFIFIALDKEPQGQALKGAKSDAAKHGLSKWGIGKSWLHVNAPRAGNAERRPSNSRRRRCARNRWRPYDVDRDRCTSGSCHSWVRLYRHGCWWSVSSW